MVPRELKGLRACLRCNLVKTMDQFYKHGCENCKQECDMENNKDEVYKYTTASFNGYGASRLSVRSLACNHIF